MDNKWLFTKYQKPLVRLANNPFGRRFLGVDHEVKEKIVGLAPNAYTIRKSNGLYRATFRCYPVFAKRLASALSSVEIFKGYKQYRGLNQYAGLLNYCGLLEQPRLFPKLWLTITDYFPTAGGDGRVMKFDSNNWDTTHNAETGQEVDQTSTADVPAAGKSAVPLYVIGRGFFPINVSALPGGAVISAALFKLNVNTTSDADNDGEDYVVVVGETSQAATNQLVVADYDTCGAVHSVTQGSDQIDIGNITTGDVYNTWTLNATGRGWITPGGTAMLGMREGHDVLDHAIAVTGYNYLTIYLSDYAGTTRDPKLEVTYSLGGSFLLNFI